jgi:hypothetical protein
VLAAAAARREHIVPDLGAHDRRGDHAASRTTRSKVEDDESKRGPRRPRPERLPWAELLRQTSLADVLACHCGGRRRVLAMVCDSDQGIRCAHSFGAGRRAVPTAGSGANRCKNARIWSRIVRARRPGRASGQPGEPDAV